MSEKLNARRFQLPDKVWNKMTDAEIWTANKKFLDRTINRGGDVLLSNPTARKGSYYEKELKYMMSKGYKLSSDKTKLLAP